MTKENTTDKPDHIRDLTLKIDGNIRLVYTSGGSVLRYNKEGHVEKHLPVMTLREVYDVALKEIERTMHTLDTNGEYETHTFHIGYNVRQEQQIPF